MIKREKNTNKSLRISACYPRHSAFALIELLITIAILATLAAIGSINLFGYYSRQNFNLSVEEITTLLRDVQNRATTQQDGDNDGQGDQWGIHFINATTTQDFVQLFSGPSYASSTIASAHSLRTGSQFTDPSEGNSKDVIFSKITGLPNASTTVTISLASNSSVSSTITINANGKIQY